MEVELDGVGEIRVSGIWVLERLRHRASNRARLGFWSRTKSVVASAGDDRRRPVRRRIGLLHRPLRNPMSLRDLGPRESVSLPFLVGFEFQGLFDLC